MSQTILSRRQWLGACSSTALLSCEMLRAAESIPVTPKFCTLGFGTYGLPKHRILDAIDVVARAGYDSIEICAIAGRDSSAENLSKASRTEIRKKLDGLGLRLTSVMENLRPFESRHPQDLERLKRACALAHELSPNHPAIVQTVMGGRQWKEVKAIAVQRFGDWKDLGEASDTVVAIKPHRGHAMSRPSEAAFVLKELGTPGHLKMWFDYSHFAFRDMPLAETIDQSIEITAGIAIKDAVLESGRVRFDLPGAAGTINYPLLLSRFFQGGYRGDVCVEVSSQVWRQEGYDGVVASKQCYERMAKAFGEAKVPRPS